MMINVGMLERGNVFTFSDESDQRGRRGYADRVEMRMNLSNEPIVVVTGHIVPDDGTDFVWFALPEWKVWIGS